jgi:hypothetical protein
MANAKPANARHTIATSMSRGVAAKQHIDPRACGLMCITNEKGRVESTRPCSIPLRVD